MEVSASFCSSTPWGMNSHCPLYRRPAWAFWKREKSLSPARNQTAIPHSSIR